MNRLNFTHMKKRFVRLKRNFFETDNKLIYLIQKILLLSNLKLRFKIKISDNSFIMYNCSKEAISFFLNKTFKLEERSFFFNFLNAGDTFVDVGANIGAFSIIAKEKVGNNGKCYAFEPNPKVYNEMIANFKANNYDIEAFNCPLSNTNNDTNFYIRKYSDDFGSLSQKAHDGDVVLKVKAMRADSVIDLAHTIDLVKIDVEGAEFFVLQGFGDVLKRVKFIKFENHFELFNCFNIQYIDIYSLLRNYDFEIYQLKTKMLMKLHQDYDSSKREDLFALRDKDIDEFIERTGYEFT